MAPRGRGAAGALPEETTVLIVGGGPVGLMASILLEHQGIDTVVAERRTEAQSAPAAHVVNARTFEICRAAGLDMERIGRACQPAEEGAWVRWVTSLTGRELGKVPFEGQHRLTELLEITPTPLRNLSQNRFEPILADHVPHLFRGVEWIDALPDSSGVTSTLRRTDTGCSSTIRSTYVIGADGAGSPLRHSLGIGMTGPDQLQAFVMIHARADLRALVADRPATLYWIMDPKVRGTLVAHDLGSTWVYMQDWDPGSEPLDSYTPGRCEEIFRRAAGIEGHPEVAVDIETVSSWRMTCQIADRYRLGRTFLVGDAAHRFPPTGGLGLNTGVADAHNLAWKIAAVEQGWATPEVLDTYESERRPVAEVNATKSLENAVKLIEVWTALGATDDPDQSITAADAVLATESGRDAVRRAAEAQDEHFDMLGLQLGVAYPSGRDLVLDDGSSPPPPSEGVRDYRPTTRPGARLPHAWVDRHGRRLSTLDLADLGTYTLLTSSPSWAAAGHRCSGGALPLEVVLMGRDALDPTGAWSARAEIGGAGAILVRPDQHVAWRATRDSADPEGDLRAVLDALGGRVDGSPGADRRGRVTR